MHSVTTPKEGVRLILAFIEDGTIEVNASTEHACAAYDGLDVEAEVVVFFDDKGTQLKPVFSKPNRYFNFLGLLSWSSGGTYTLEQDDSTGRDPLWLMLAESDQVDGSEQFGSVAQLKAHLAGNGAIVERQTDDSEPD